MTKGISLHIGLNYVNPDHYNGWDGKLSATEFDAKDMQQICKTQGFQTESLLRSEATIKNVVNSIKRASESLNSNDFFCITYSGHGGQLPDLNFDEEDGMDETWCLFDGQLIDDNLANLWTSFKAGVRILIISDSCHSGTVAKLMNYRNINYSKHAAKFMPSEVAVSTYLNNKEFYDELLSEPKPKTSIKASVKLISGCQDNQYSYDGTFNGQFTARLKRIWNGGRFSGNYNKFHKEILNLLPSYQTPNYYNTGSINEMFNNQKPFTI